MMSKPQFVVRAERLFVVKRNGYYVATLDGYDGSMEYTDDILMARLFQGDEWRDFWNQVEGAEFQYIGTSPVPKMTK